MQHILNKHIVPYHDQFEVDINMEPAILIPFNDTHITYYLCITSK